MGTRGSRLLSPAPSLINSLRTDPQNYLSLLPADLFSLCQPFIYAALNIPRLGRDTPFNSNDQEYLFDVAIFDLVPRKRRVTLSSVDQVYVMQKGDPVIGAILPSESKGVIAFTRRGVITPKGYVNWQELSSMDFVRKARKIRYGRAVELIRETPFSSEWDAFAERLHEVLEELKHRRSPTGIHSPHSFASSMQWIMRPQEVAQRLALFDPSPEGFRRAIVTIARDLKCKPLYPAIAPATLSTTLAACNMPTDRGVILLQYLTDHTGFRMVELLVTETELMWVHYASSQSKTVHSLPYTSLGSQSAEATLTYHNSGNRNFRCRIKAEKVDEVVGGPNLVPGRGSGRIFPFLIALHHLLVARNAPKHPHRTEH